jgi:hypothetical protein
VDTWRCFNSKLSKLESSIQSEPKAHSFNKDVSTPIKYSTNYFGFFLPSLHQFEARIFIWLWASRHHVPSFKLLPRVINCYQRACRAFLFFSIRGLELTSFVNLHLERKTLTGIILVCLSPLERKTLPVIFTIITNDST